MSFYVKIKNYQPYPEAFQIFLVASPTARRGSGKKNFSMKQVTSCGIYGVQNDIGASFLQVLRFPLRILIPPTAPHSLIILPSTLYNLHTESVVQ
jgi:hypothetical protein